MSASPAFGETASALLGPAESVLKARPLRSWQAAQKEAVRARLAAACRDWCAEWLPERGASTAVDVEVAEPDGTMVLTSDNTAAWSFAEAPRRATAPVLDMPSRSSRDATPSALQAIGERLFAFDVAVASSAPAAATIAPAVVQAAWADWLRRLGALWPGFALEPQQARNSPGTRAPAAPWSGDLCARWTWCGGVWRLGLPNDMVKALLGSEAATPSATPVAQGLPKERLDLALAAEQVALRVVLDGAELNLGQLQGLRLDDIVPLSHLLDAPALVIAVDGTPVCNGWLGQSEGRLAVELTPQTPNLHSLKENTL